MATDTTVEKRTMLAAFKQKKKPTNFLSGWFRTTDRDIFRSRKAVIDIKRNNEAIAIDVVRGTGGRLNNNKRFTTKEYTPPIYDEYTAYFEEELNERMPGQTEYTDMQYMAQFLAILTDDQVELQEQIVRSIEVQAAQALFSGAVTLINNDSLDFKQKATHNFAAAGNWNVAGSIPTNDFITAATLNRKDGKTDSKIAIFGEQAWEDFLARNQATGTGDGNRFDLINAKLADIKQPVPNTNGAVFHGTFTAGSYQFQAWTYPQFYLVPTGFGLANEGTLVPYVPTDLVAVLPMADQIDLRLIHAGIPALVNRVDNQLSGLGISQIPMNIRADFHPYAVVDDEKTCVKAGVRSAPLVVPTQIDGWSIIKSRG
jgi:hypothetical protein